ncbi:MAG: hypothetical protein ACOX5R_02850 [bacterium]|jgi:hypothetical protein
MRKQHILMFFCLLICAAVSQAAELKAPWMGGSVGAWYTEDGILKVWNTGSGDPNHVWVDIPLETGDYTVQADVRIMGWTNEDASRAGVAIRINPDTRQGLNLLFHEDLNSVDFLNDGTAWGTRGDYAWEVGTWYTMTITGAGDTLTGTVVPRDGSSEPFVIEWTDDRNDDRSPGLPGLTGPNNLGRMVEFDNFSVTLNGEVVFEDDFGANVEPDPLTPLSEPWVTGTYPEWGLLNGYLVSRALTQGDPRHVWVNQDFGSDYTVRADVRLLNWLNADHSRAGVAVRINPDDQERGLNLLLHEDTGSVDMLNDGTAWGTRGDFSWEPGKWYTLTLEVAGNTLTGSIVARDLLGATPYSIEWTDDRNAERAPGFPGLTGSTGANIVAQFDNFEVLVNDEVVFADDFGANVETDWVIKRYIPIPHYTLGQMINNISLTVDVNEGITLGSVVIEEILPTDIVPANIEASSGDTSFADGRITWTLSNVSADQTLTYDIQAPQRPNITLITWGGSAIVDGTETPLDGLSYVHFLGDVSIPVLAYNISESFSYPSGNDDNAFEGQTIAGRNGGRGWGGNAWFAVNSSETVVFDTMTIDAGLVQSQPTEYNPGNYSARLTGLVEGGLARTFPMVIDNGELWISYTFREEGPAADHWSGITLYNDEGNEVVFVGKPYNAGTLGIGNLPGDDALADYSYQDNHHLLVRIVIAGNESEVYLWVDPDKQDRMDTYDAMGMDDISNIQEIRLRRGNGSGSAYYDNMWFSSVPALPPAGAGRVDLQIDNPDRPAELPAFDVISMDQFDDAFVGEYGFGHDPNEDHYLVVSGFIYFDANLQQVVAFGLPPDRMSGLNGHILGHFNFEAERQGFKNAIKFENNDQQRGPFTFLLDPPGRYKELRSAQTVASGDGQLFCTLNYADGTTEDTFLNADDWYHDPAEGNINFDNVLLLVDGMNRLQGADSSFDARFDPAVFECYIPVDPTKVLESITLEYNEEVDDNAAYNLFDIWAVPADDPTGVENWSLF